MIVRCALFDVFGSHHSIVPVDRESILSHTACSLNRRFPLFFDMALIVPEAEARRKPLLEACAALWLGNGDAVSLGRGFNAPQQKLAEAIKLRVQTSMLRC